MQEVFVEKDVIELKNNDYKHKNIIYEMRIKNYLKLQELADLINEECAKLGKTTTYSKQTVSLWENGKRTPLDKTTVQAISNVLYIPLDELIKELKRI